MLNDLGNIYQKLEKSIRYAVVSLAACTILTYPFLFMYIPPFEGYAFPVQLMLAMGAAGIYLGFTTPFSCVIQPPPYSVFVPIPLLAMWEFSYLWLVNVKGMNWSLESYWGFALIVHFLIFYFTTLLLFVKICLNRIKLILKYCWRILKKLMKLS